MNFIFNTTRHFTDFSHHQHARAVNRIILEHLQRAIRIFQRKCCRLGTQRDFGGELQQLLSIFSRVGCDASQIFFLE